MYEISKADMKRGGRLKTGAIVAPVALTLVPLLLTFVLTFVLAASPPTAAIIFFLGIVATLIGAAIGATAAIVLGTRYSRWKVDMRERIAADGIRADEIGWFTKELKPSEKRALKAVEARDELLGDAFRETLASRLTATRIIRNSRRELTMAKKRQNSVRQLKSARSSEFQEQIASDITKIQQINEDARLMLAEAESRLAMIEAAATRSGQLADNELALKRLSARSKELPLALESARMADEIRQELEREGLDTTDNEKDAD
jgi:hypothetical protein